MSNNTQHDPTALSTRERILRGLQAMAAALNAADAWTDEARAGYQAASATQYPQDVAAVAPAGAGTPPPLSEDRLRELWYSVQEPYDPLMAPRHLMALTTRLIRFAGKVRAEPIEEAGAVAPPDALTEIAKYLTPGNQNVTNGDLVACIRDLAQVALSEKGNSETAQQQLETAEQQREMLSGTVRQDAAVIADLIGQKEAAERARDEAIALNVTIESMQIERSLAVAAVEKERNQERQRAEAAEATLATLRTLVDEFETDFVNALDTVSDTVIFAQCTVPTFVKAVTAALTGDPAGTQHPSRVIATDTVTGVQRERLAAGPQPGDKWAGDPAGTALPTKADRTCARCGHYDEVHGSLDCVGWMPAGTGHAAPKCPCTGFVRREPAGTVPPAPATDRYRCVNCGAPVIASTAHPAGPCYRCGSRSGWKPEARGAVPEARPCGVAGFPSGERRVCELQAGHEYHRAGSTRWLGYHTPMISELAEARAAAQAPQAPDDALDIYVPGRLRCPRCAFELTRAVLHAATGEIGMGRREVYMESEPCPNDGTPMARVTWQQEADSNQRYAMQLIADVLAATGADSLPAAFAKIKGEAASAPAPHPPKS